MNSVGSLSLSFWAALLRLSRTPLQYESRSRSFFRYEVGSRAEGYRLKKEKITPRKTKRRKAFRSASRTYRQVVRQLKEAIEGGQVQTGFVTANHRIETIKAPSLWSDQRRLIFYTGGWREKDPKGVYQLHRVLVDRKSFAAWLTRGDQDRQAEPPQKFATVANFEPGLLLLAKKIEEGGYRLTRGNLGDLLQAACEKVGTTVSKRELDLFWRSSAISSIRHPHGASSKVERSKFDQDREDLIRILVEHYRTARADPRKGDR